MRVLALALLLTSAVAQAQTPEAQPPGSGGYSPEAEPPGAPPPRNVQPSTREDEVDIGKFQLGARVRTIFVTHLMLQPYLAGNTGTSMTSYSVGLEFIYRRINYDIVTSLDFSALDIPDGNWLGAGHDPTADSHFVEFKNFNFVSVDVSFIGHHKFLPWLELRYGGGLGLGAVLGDVWETNNWSNCTLQNASDITQCHPVGVTLGQPNTQQQLQQTENRGVDTAGNPVHHITTDKPPVMGVVNLLIGLRFYPVKRMAITAELGFRDAMFAGVGVHYLF
jgi:hypothetical protein